MDGGRNGLTGPNHHLASKAAEEEISQERDGVATHHRHTMVETVRERMLKFDNAKPAPVKVCESKPE